MTAAISADKRLDALTTLGTVSSAEFYAEADSLADLKALLAEAQSKGLRVHLLGGGANTVALSRVEGLVIRLAIKGFAIERREADAVYVRAGCGERLDDVVRRTVEAGIGGLENLSAIPGTVGGAVVQNVGAYGVELAERFESAEVYDRVSGEVRTLDVTACDFSYRSSVFKKEAGRNLIVLSALFRLPQPWKPETSYRDLAAYLQEKGIAEKDLTPAAVSAAVRDIRAKKLPDPAVIGNAGSFFTNPILPKVFWREVQAAHPTAVYYKLPGGRVKLSAASLIDIAGFKGCTRGRAGVYDRHALILVNRGGATGEEVLALADEIAAKVKEIFGVTLAREPVVL
jgi:UDP-N-acetylmuramate dehydrogenase